MKKELCKNCTYYTAYFKQWSDHYSRLSHGICSKHKKPQTQFHTCEHYASNEQKEEMRADRRMKSLERALASINDIAQILKEKTNGK